VFSPGYLKGLDQYSLFLSTISKHFNLTNSFFVPVSNDNDMSSEVNEMLSIGEATNPSDVLLFSGHSRGGAVAALAASMFAASNPKRSTLCLLIDPVDTVDRRATKLLTQMRDDSPSTYSASSFSTQVPRTLIVSTPFGGKSSYYRNAAFVSSCAPPTRNADAFFDAMNRSERVPPLLSSLSSRLLVEAFESRGADDVVPVSQEGVSLKFLHESPPLVMASMVPSRLQMATLPSVGHLDLLDRPEELSVCASNRGVDGRALILEVVESWLDEELRQVGVEYRGS
jgi:pimeloyl-ACP methyl ester carboxylesterase